MFKLFDSTQGAASKKSINLKIDYDTNLPKVVVGDKVRIRQVLLNLLNNALKFTDVGGNVDLVCKLEGIEDNIVRVFFMVGDNGVGIDNEQLKLIFESFNKEDTTVRTEIGGLGFSLSISRHLVRVMGGDIIVESKLGKGSKFFFSLDLELGKEDEIDDKLEYKKNDPEMLKGYSILLVEDSEFNQDVGRRILENWGAEVIIAEDGQKAVDIIEDKFDVINLVFMDIRMPIMDGIEATRIIRNKLHYSKPIVALTGEALKETIEECGDAGMDDFVSKPFNKITIENILKKYLEKSDRIIDDVDDEPNNEIDDDAGLVTDSEIQYSTDALLEMLGGSEESLKKILIKFIEETPSRVVKMEEMFLNENWEMLQSQAHTIKSSLRYLKSDDAVKDCQTLEDYAKKREFHSEMKPLMLKISSIVTKLVEQVKSDFSL